jgi:DNA-directed RNA polymerase specialized sigma24 family protein
VVDSLLGRVRRTTAAAISAGLRRDAAIAAAAEKHSYSEIAEAAGLSKPRVQQIVTAARKAK